MPDVITCTAACHVMEASQCSCAEQHQGQAHFCIMRTCSWSRQLWTPALKQVLLADVAALWWLQGRTGHSHAL